MCSHTHKSWKWSLSEVINKLTRVVVLMLLTGGHTKLGDKFAIVYVGTLVRVSLIDHNGAYLCVCCPIAPPPLPNGNRDEASPLPTLGPQLIWFTLEPICCSVRFDSITPAGSCGAFTNFRSHFRRRDFRATVCLCRSWHTLDWMNASEWVGCGQS